MPECRILGGWGGLEPLFQPPPPTGGGSRGRLSFFHVFHAYLMATARLMAPDFVIENEFWLHGGIADIDSCPIKFYVVESLELVELYGTQRCKANLRPSHAGSLSFALHRGARRLPVGGTAQPGVSGANRALSDGASCSAIRLEGDGRALSPVACGLCSQSCRPALPPPFLKSTLGSRRAWQHLRILGVRGVLPSRRVTPAIALHV